MKRHRIDNADRIREYDRKRGFRSYDKAKERARQKVRTALKSGRLTRQPCHCGSTTVEAHHHDYSKPLDVVWLCRTHHAELHHA
ncbi:MAG: hypothetical protein BWY85_00441 [Firmicutes bacterium ADurb.Bin506]|nr:MAG: hypothetical protein BWY85_00441 [Firmicutes bacterium ADurb.Bin506]